MTRASCEHLLKDWVPHRTPRSACVYCPLHDDAEWLQVKQVPEDWSLATSVDEALRDPSIVENGRRANRMPMFLHLSLQPLVQIDFGDHPRESWVGFRIECSGACGN